MSIRSALATAATLASAATCAQPDRMWPPPPPPAPGASAPTDGRWRGSLGVALAATSGNTRTRSALLNGDGVRQTAADRTSVGALVQYADSRTAEGQSTTANRFAAWGRYDYNLDARRFAFARLGLERDRLRRLALRRTVDTGLGWKLVDTQPLRASVFAGLGYTRDRYDAAQTIGDRSATRFSRASLYLAEESAHELTGTVRARQRLEVNSGISGDRAQLARFSAHLDVAMTSTLALSVGAIATYNSRPPEGQRSNDLSLFTGVNLKFDGR